MDPLGWIRSCAEQQAALGRRVAELKTTNQLRPFIEETEDWLVGCEAEVPVNMVGVDLESWRIERMKGPEALTEPDRDHLRKLIGQITFGGGPGDSSTVA